MAVRVLFEHGTLVVTALPEEAASLEGLLTEDRRTGRYRAPAFHYRRIIESLRRLGVPYEDQARRYQPIPLAMRDGFSPYPHQAEALERWEAAGCTGVVEMPTGSGKTLLGALAIARAGRPALVVVPTIELLGQWQRTLEAELGIEIGVIGGGLKERRDVTVITYDSAAIMAEHLGARFGMLVFDEVHHLPSDAYRFAAEASIAPFRLGLTATLARPDGKERLVYERVGPLVHQVGVESLEGRWLAPYSVVPVRVELDPEESEVHDRCRAEYLAFLRQQGIDFRRPDAFSTFVARAHQSEAGRSAWRAYRSQRRIALSSRAKMSALWSLLVVHRHDRVLVFTNDNETVYRVSRTFLLPALTHQTRPAERKRLLEGFSTGDLRVLVTAKVLNEGVDVPEANVAIVMSGSGSVREHVQRLGRVLRRREGKSAVLYELVSDVTTEVGLAERRRQHEAYARVEDP